MKVVINTVDGKRYILEGTEDNRPENVLLALSGTGFVNVCNGIKKRWIKREHIVSFSIVEKGVMIDDEENF